MVSGEACGRRLGPGGPLKGPHDLFLGYLAAFLLSALEAVIRPDKQAEEQEGGADEAEADDEIVGGCEESLEEHQTLAFGREIG
jgi:hypothetical protein